MPSVPTPRRVLLPVALLAAALLAGCPDPSPAPPQPWQLLGQDLDQALMGVGGSAADDVWMVGASRNVLDPDGPLVLQWDGAAWTRHKTGQRNALWWVHAFADGPIFIGGAGATVLRHDRGAPGSFARMRTPGLANQTVYGVWGSSPSDVWAVGGIAGRSCFVWHFDGDIWSDVRLPEPMLKDPAGEVPSCLKVWGRGPDDVWIVGGRGLVMHSQAGGGLEIVPTDTTSPLFTVHGDAEEVVMVGGASNGFAVDYREGEFVDRTPSAVGLIQGVCLDKGGAGYAVGAGGVVFERTKDAWKTINTGINYTAQSLHAVWMDPDGGVWTVGGNVLTSLLNQGSVLYRPASAKATIPPRFSEEQIIEPPVVTCPAADLDRVPNASIARRWSDQMLRAVSRDIPRPVVHARNLYHVSAALYDAWAAFEPTARQLFASDRAAEAISIDDAAREEAMSHAAYRVLMHRYAGAAGGAVSAACFNEFMTKIGFDPTETSVEGDSPAALGNRIGQTIVDMHVDDGANEANNYADTTGFKSSNPALPVDIPGARVNDITEWQLMNIAVAETQNGLILEGGVQSYVGAQWTDVTPFALTREDPEGLYLDPGPPPQEIDELRDGAVRLLRIAARLTPNPDDMMDISPGAMGNGSLGKDDGTGHALNPETGLPYAPNLVKAGDFHRIMSEYWADGPETETPPGHWNNLGNEVADALNGDYRIMGSGESVDRLEWDTKFYLAMNGAMHDAAIVAWQVKRFFLTARPISIIRWMGQNGQSSDPTSPTYHQDGLPLEDGLIELITEVSTRPGERHAHLHPYIGEIAVFSWRGEPGDRKHEIGGVGWIRAKEWMPFQRRTFVTPPFPGFVSGHSTYSRAGAGILARFTGRIFFPGGIIRHTYKKNSFLFFEVGPSEDVEIQWATYYDAADQSGRSRVSGGIHIDNDDFPGRRLGAKVAELAMDKARSLWEAPAAE